MDGQNFSGHHQNEAQTGVAADGGPQCVDTHISDAPEKHDGPVECAPPRHELPVILTLKELHRQRQDLHQEEKSLVLRVKAIGRRLRGHCENASHPGIATEDFAALRLLECIAFLKPHRKALERQMVKCVKQLPFYEFCESVHGFGAFGLAQIVAEAGDLSNYDNPAKLWKRMGLAVINGKSQRRVSGSAAFEQGYSPKRRAIMFCIGDSLIKKQNEYREIYLQQKERYREKWPEASQMHVHRAAQRYMEKRLLRNLWRAWRSQAPKVGE